MNHPLREYDLRELIDELVGRYPSIESVVIFGSRNFGTQSDRSDIDLIIKHDAHIKPVELRNLTQEMCPALDLFLCRDNVAVSCANESCVSADSFNQLIERLGGTTLWTRADQFSEDYANWEFRIPVGIDFKPTVALLSFEQYETWAPRIRDFMAGVEAAGFPTSPFVGVTAVDVANAMIVALHGAVGELPSLETRGRDSCVTLKNEYDFQNLFHLICKSWFPGLAREEVTIKYDGQDKIADFSFLDSQLVFEFKHIRDGNTKAAVVKTLTGLTEFYTTHPNISILINVVLVDAVVTLDDRRMEADYSYHDSTPQVWTTVIRNRK